LNVANGNKEINYKFKSSEGHTRIIIRDITCLSKHS